MKNIFYVILIFSRLNSCKSNTKQEQKDTTISKSGAKQTESIIQKFKPIIQGAWVKKDYIDIIIKTKSPLVAMREANYFIITGNYVLTDSLSKVSKISFDNDGKILGFSGFSKYYINSDLNSYPMDNLDEIGFDIRSKTHQSFSYKINRDTLSLYNTYPNADSTELVLGKRVYKLVRQK